MSDTEKNLREAFAGESQANRRYLFFADKAEKEGHSSIARLFRAAAEAETVHAYNHLRNMDGIKSTRENLEAAITGEHHEFTKMYPAFIEQAKEEGNRRAGSGFNFASKVEKVHHDLYQKALEAIEAGKQLKDEPYFVCGVCGYTVGGEVPDECPICGAPGSRFKRVD